MSGGKPTVPENIMGTLTLSDHEFAHTSNLTNFRYRYYTLATLDYLEPVKPEKYVRVVAFSPDSLRTFFYRETVSICCSSTIKSSSLVT